MIPKDEKVLTLREAEREVEVAITRLALLHLSFSNTLVRELGEQRGKELIIKSIMEYGKLVGERIKRGLQSLPKYGVYEGSKDGKIYGCILAKVFREHGEEDLGSLYCYVDPAQTMAVNPRNKLVHPECASVGDEYCTLQLVPTTENEQKAFENRDPDWKKVDPRLAAGVKKRRE